MVDDTMAPPWVAFPDQPASHIGWRMGGGETYLLAFATWISAFSREERLAFLRRHAPIPADWILWATDTLALPDTDDEALDAALDALVSNGLMTSEG